MLLLDDLQTEVLKKAFESSFENEELFSSVSMSEIIDLLTGREVSGDLYDALNDEMTVNEIDSIWFACWLAKREEEAVSPKLEFYEMAHNIKLLKDRFYDRFKIEG